MLNKMQNLKAIIGVRMPHKIPVIFYTQQSMQSEWRCLQNIKMGNLQNSPKNLTTSNQSNQKWPSGRRIFLTKTGKARIGVWYGDTLLKNGKQNLPAKKQKNGICRKTANPVCWKN
ncbi:hypothetical protein KAU11_00230 [Candidatus Babeliales bacterium]|nr:hypothetical protein [Candidatus Babeliales bacterium]